MQEEKYGYKWTQKASGYFQSTINFPDGTRHWLHQEVYLREKGALLAGHHIHHLDEDKTNNAPYNLEQLGGSAHSVDHMKCAARRAISSKTIKELNPTIQLLAQAAKRGEYIGQQALRQMQKGNKRRVCAYCGKPFTLKDTDKDGTKYCQFDCAQRGSRAARGIKPLTKKNCLTCGKLFEQVTGNQSCCSEVCRKVNTEKKRKTNKVFKVCVKCGGKFETIKSSKRKYCTDDCKKSK